MGCCVFLLAGQTSDMDALGIKKRGHRAKLMRAVKKLAQLQFQGRTAEGSFIVFFSRLFACCWFWS
jgi:hypothetical protein